MADEQGDDRIRAARLKKLERLEAAGLSGYPTQTQRTHRAAEVDAQFDALQGTRVCVAGRLGVFKTFGKKLAFAFLQDDSGQIQLILHPQELSESARLVYEVLDPGDFANACGVVVKSKTGETSVEVSELTLLSKALRNPPEKWHGLV